MRLPVSLCLIAGAVTCFESSFYPIKGSSQDQSSFANVDYIRTTDFNLTLDVDFDKTVIQGTNTLTLTAVRDVTEIVLDYQGLYIESASYSNTNLSTGFIDAFFETQTDSQLGSALRVFMTDKARPTDVVILRVQFYTTNQSLAINWLTKE